eukprot:12103052-Karenia_brevis.AAC.1
MIETEGRATAFCERVNHNARVREIDDLTGAIRGRPTHNLMHELRHLLQIHMCRLKELVGGYDLPQGRLSDLFEKG